MNQYMVDFTLPTRLSDKFNSLVPNQRALINRYFSDGKLLSYAVSLERARVWAVFTARDENEVRDMVDALPLTRFMPDYDIHVLTFYNLLSTQMPNFSVN